MWPTKHVRFLAQESEPPQIGIGVQRFLVHQNQHSLARSIYQVLTLLNHTVRAVGIGQALNRP